MSTRRVIWRKRLEPFAEVYAAMDAAIEKRLGSMTDDELRKTLAATKRPTGTNVWWATYHVAPILADAVVSEQARRKVERKIARKAAHGPAVALLSPGVQDGAR